MAQREVPLQAEFHAGTSASGGLKVAISTRVNAQKATGVPGAGGTSAIPARKQCTVTTLWPATSLWTLLFVDGRKIAEEMAREPLASNSGNEDF